MNAQAPGRGAELAAGGRRVGLGPQWLARLWSGGINKVLDRIDAGLDRGSISTTLPDGTTRLLGGRSPGFDAVVELKDARALLRLATAGSVGWYQAWEAGEWDSPDPVPLFALFMQNGEGLGNAGRALGPWRLVARFMHWLRRNTRTGSVRNIQAHYDLGNDFYACWLDPTMSYSSARFDCGSGNLEAAQQRKLKTVSERVAGAASVLEIGCGWGSQARSLADHGAAVTAISLSDEQLEWARAHHVQAGIDFRKQDYRDVAGQFDGIVSVEMVEAVGREFWASWFDCIARCLKPGGRAAIQYIAMRDDLFEAYARSADFIQTYIFPGGLLVRETEFQRLASERGLSWTDQTSFGTDYAETLRLWRENFDRTVSHGELPSGFDARFVRLWRFYLMYCEGGFRGGGIDVAQVTLVKA
ncbi:MAG TPA: cyclopropane-fatty-acyl-phospholipid synthase family protein [Novosphingobium sp.]